jgi:hypothetical protein
LRRSDLQERGEAGFFAGIGFPHAEHVADISALHVTDHDHPAGEVAVADTPFLAVFATGVRELEGRARKHDCCVVEIETALLVGAPPLSQIVSESHYYCSYRYYRRQPAISLAACRPVAESRNTGFID